MLLATIKSNAQLFKDSKTVNQLDSAEMKKLILGSYSASSSVTYKWFKDTKIHIDSAYLQRIIEALEEKGYTLVKLPKKDK